jgi:hypothetical protein
MAPKDDYLDSLNKAPKVEQSAEDVAMTKVASSAKGLGKLFSDIGGDLASMGGEVATSVAGQVQAGWEKKRLGKLQKARLNDVVSELTALSEMWESCSFEQKEDALEEAFTTTFKLLQSVQNQEDGNAVAMSEDIKDLEALATKRIVLKKD